MMMIMIIMMMTRLCDTQPGHNGNSNGGNKKKSRLEALAASRDRRWEDFRYSWCHRMH